MTPDDTTSDELHFQRFAARLFLDDLENGPAPVAVTVTATRITRYALRDGSLADLDVEREIRRNPRARSLYFGLLAGRAVGSGLEAAASSGGASRVVEIDGHRLELVEEEDGMYVVIHLADPHTRLTAIEVRSREDGEGVRADLPAPIARTIQLHLDPRDETLRRLDAALRRRDMEIHLL